MAADRAQLPIREARWLQSPDLVADLTTQPPECLAWPADTAQRSSVAVGRALFRSPLLLGGQAARAGLSCASCHRNGRSNPHFHFPGISGNPGTADVTASIMSEHRGDGIFNPKPIPDLGGDPAKLKVKRTAKLRAFVRGLITQEFDGPQPSPAALDSVVAYVRALGPGACPTGGREPITLAAHLAEVGSAVDLARAAYAQGDTATGRALLAAARSTLGAIDQRFQLAGLDGPRAKLKAADAQLFALQEGKGSWAEWRRDWPRHERTLRSAGPRSLYNPAVLRNAL
ncbi:MAG: hypothetical protein ACJ8D6_03310 [Sphingomicrobium sp.]